jgi:hypothetical protein
LGLLEPLQWPLLLVKKLEQQQASEHLLLGLQVRQPLVPKANSQAPRPVLLDLKVGSQRRESRRQASQSQLIELQ